MALRLITELTEADDPVVAAVQVALRMDRQLLGKELAVAQEIKVGLEEARKEIFVKLAVVEKDWQRWQLESVLNETINQMNQWELRSRSATQTGLTDSAAFGEELALSTLSAGGVDLPYLRPTLGFAHLSAQFSYSADLIQGVSQSTITKVNTELRRAAMALDPPFEVMQRLGSVTGKGAFATAFHRGEAIARTEMGRSYSMSNHATQLELQKLNPGLGKAWLAVIDGRTRAAHIAANDQKRPLKEPFNVGGDRLMYPKDPNGSAENTINCRCVSMPWHPSWDEPLPDAEPKPPELNPHVAGAAEGVAEFQRWSKDLNAFMGRYNKRLADTSLPRFQGGGRGRPPEEELGWSREYDALKLRLEGIERRFRKLGQFGLNPANLAQLGQLDIEELRRMVTGIRGGTPASFSTLGNDPLQIGWGSWNTLSISRSAFADMVEQILTRARIGTIPLADRVLPRPSRKGLKQTAYDVSLAVGNILEELGYRTTWTGGIAIGGAGRGSAASYRADAVTVINAVRRYSTSNQHSLLLHEQLHGVSEYHGTGYGSDGWEEGVVEMVAQQVMPTVQERFGLPTLGYQTYAKFTSALEVLRSWVDMPADEFYPTLIKMPAGDRQGWVGSRLPPDARTLTVVDDAFNTLSLGPKGGR